MARSLSVTATTWEPLSGGLLTGRFGSDREPPSGTRIGTTEYAERVVTDRNLAIADAVNAVAAERDASPAQVAIAWLLAQQERAVIVPIVGSRRREQIEDSLGAVDVALSREELDRLDAAGAIELGFPHDFPGRAMAYGNTYARIDGHRPQVWTDGL